MTGIKTDLPKTELIQIADAYYCLTVHFCKWLKAERLVCHRNMKTKESNNAEQ